MSSSKLNMPKEPKNASTTFVAYNEEEVYGEQVNLMVGRRNLTLHTQVMLKIQELLWGKSSEVRIKKILIRWCPLVEPTTQMMISIGLNYDIGDDSSNPEDNKTVLRFFGKASEQVVIEHKPTHPIIKRSSHAFYNPWITTVSVDDWIDSGNKHMIGVLKCWCHFDLKILNSDRHFQFTTYLIPKIIWTNQYFPYYVPLIIRNPIRGINMMMWRDTQQYKSYLAEIACHLDRNVITPSMDLGIMQTVSQQDFDEMKEMTKDCHSNKGGSCTCGDKPTKFLSSIVHNNHGRCSNHGQLFDDLARAVITGKFKSVPDNVVIKF